MRKERYIESFVGLFILLGMMALLVLAFKVSGLTQLFPQKTYAVTAEFDDIGGLKPRAAVKLGGVQIGEVSAISLDPVTFKAIVTMAIRDRFNQIPDDSSVGILTAGLLGDNYIEVTPMYSAHFLKNGSEIEMTRSAMILEKLIGQLVYKISGGNGGDSDNNKNTADASAKVATN